MSGKGPIPPPTHPKPKPAPNSARSGSEPLDNTPIPPEPRTPPPPPPPKIAEENPAVHTSPYDANGLQDVHGTTLAPEGHPPPPPPTPPPKAPKTASGAGSGLALDTVGCDHGPGRIHPAKAAPGDGHPVPPQPQPDPVPPPRTPKSARAELVSPITFAGALGSFAPINPTFAAKALFIGKGCGSRIGSATHKDTRAMRALLVF